MYRFINLVSFSFSNKVGGVVKNTPYMCMSTRVCIRHGRVFNICTTTTGAYLYHATKALDLSLHQRPTKFFAPSSQHLTVSNLFTYHPVLFHDQTVLACNKTTNSRQNVRANPKQEARHDSTVGI